MVLTTFFQTLPIPSDQLIGSYDPRLVILSYMVAVFASYIALDITGRLRDVSNTEVSGYLWLLGGAIAMGCGIWSMHFIGMLSFTIPTIGMRYDIFWTVLSLLVAILASGFALFLLKSKTLSVSHLVYGGIVLGLGIASMHYTGMEAWRIEVNIHYLLLLFSVSILIAILASEAAIWLAIKSNQAVLRMRNRLKFSSAVIMGLAICGMHYTGMAAAVFTSACISSSTVTPALDPTILAISIAIITFVILAIAFFASAYKEALTQQQVESARQLGMAEVSASVLHNVGNVLNSVNVSTDSIGERIASSKLIMLEGICDLLNKHKHDMANFMSQDPQGAKLIEFLHKLTEYAREERKFITDEVAMLTQNIKHINCIISTQQDLSKIVSIEQVVSINDVINEALLITGLDTHKNQITVEKHYGKIYPTLSDKVKLLQVMVNLLRNSKEALLASTNIEKLLILSTHQSGNKIIMTITDKGIGILPQNIKKIFTYGFTTKKEGHGFGLHVSALSINALGGDIKVESQGAEKGATFVITLPYKNPI